MKGKASLSKEKLVYLPLALFATFAAESADINSVTFGQNVDGAYEVQIHGTDLRNISSYSLSNPARIVVDIPNARSHLAQRITQVSSPVVANIAVIEGDDRVRATVNLAKSVPHQVIDGQSKITVVVKEPSKGRLSSKSKRANKSTATRIADVGFKKGTAGQGTVQIKLPGSKTAVNVERVGKKVIAKLRGGSFGRAKRLNVMDFGTPVKSIDVFSNSLSIDTSTDEFEIVSYQNDNTFVIEFNKPDVNEVKQDDLLPGDSRKKYSGSEMGMNFQDIEVRAALQLIGEYTGTNMVISDEVSGNITLNLSGVPWDLALDTILMTKGLSMEKKDSVIIIAPSKSIAAFKEDAYRVKEIDQTRAPTQIQQIKVQYARAENLKKIIEEDRKGNKADSSNNSLLSARGYINVDARTNTLIVNDVPTNIEKVRGLIADLDVAVRQVLIDARIVSASNEFSHELGVRWGGSAVGEDTTDNGNSLNVGVAGSLEGAASAASGGASSASLSNRLGVNLGASENFGRLGLQILGADFLLDMELSAMESNGRGEVISSPRVITQDGTQATIKSGREIAYTTSSDGDVSLEYKDVSLSLDVTPTITPNNMVNMVLVVTRDNVGDYVTTSAGSAPSIDTNSVSTQVMVDNGETVVLGGVYEQTKSNSVDKVPFFGGLPIIGRAFRRDVNRINRSELLIFVTPKVVDRGYVSQDKFSTLRK